MEETKITVDTTLGRKRLIKQKTLKVRVDILDLLELDRICNKLGFAERATVMRKLIHWYANIERATNIVQEYLAMEQHKANFEALAANRTEQKA